MIPGAVRFGWQTGLDIQMLVGLVVPTLVALAVIIVASGAIKILREYERAVVFTLGRFSHVKGPRSSF